MSLSKLGHFVAYPSTGNRRIKSVSLLLYLLFARSLAMKDFHSDLIQSHSATREIKYINHLQKYMYQKQL